MTNGSRGGQLSVDGGEWQPFLARPVEHVADTTGAGDAFLAGVLVGLADGLPDNENKHEVARHAVALGTRYGAEAVQQSGGWPNRRIATT